MNRQETHAGVREILAEARTQQQYHEREITRLNKVIEGAETLLENDTEFSRTVEANRSGSVVPLRSLLAMRPSDVIKALLLQRSPEEPSKDEMFEALQQAGYDFSKANPQRVIANALSMARKRLEEESESTEA